MPKICNIVVHYMDGKTESFHGGVHVGRDVLQIWPKDGGPVRIPLVSIRRFHITPTV